MRLILLVATLLVACGDEQGPTHVEPVNEPATEDSVIEPDTADEPAPVPDGAALELPAEIPAIAEVERHERQIHEIDRPFTVRWDEVRHASDTTNGILEPLQTELAHRFAYFGDRGHCETTLASEHLVSMMCSGLTDFRGAMNEVSALNVAIDDDGIPRAVDTADAFVEGAEVLAPAMPACREWLARQIGMDSARPEGERGHFEEGECERMIEQERIAGAFTPSGLRIKIAFYRHVFTHDLPYAELRGQIAAAGILAPVLTDAPAPSPFRVPESEANAWAVSGYRPAHALLALWSTVSPGDAPHVSLQIWQSGLARAVVISGQGDDRGSAARLFGASASPLRLEAALDEVRWVRSTVDLNVRRHGQVVATLPRGALFVASSRWDDSAVRLASAHTVLGEGTLSTRPLRAHEGCIPEAPSRFGASPLRALVSARRAGNARDAVLFVAPTEERTNVAIHALTTGSCTLGEELLAFEVPGRAFDVRLVGTTEHGGHTLAVVGTPDSGRVAYTAHRLGASEPSWSRVLSLDPDGGEPEDTVRLGETVGDTYFPISYWDERLHRLAWSDTGFEDAPAP